jgi:hypothetical protein
VASSLRIDLSSSGRTCAFLSASHRQRCACARVSEQMKQTLQPSRRAIHTLACVDVLNLNDPAAPSAHRIDGMHAEPAVTDQPRHDYLSHVPSDAIFLFERSDCRFAWVEQASSMRSGLLPSVRSLNRRPFVASAFRSKRAKRNASSGSGRTHLQRNKFAANTLKLHVHAHGVSRAGDTRSPAVTGVHSKASRDGLTWDINPR